MRTLAALIFVILTPFLLSAQEAPTAPTPISTATPTPKPPKDPMKWIDVLYSRGFGPWMSKETFRFNAAVDPDVQGRWSLEVRKNLMPEDSKRYKVETATGILLERYTLQGTRDTQSDTATSQSRIYGFSVRQYVLAPQDRRMQGYAALDLGFAIEASTYHIQNKATGYYTDVQARDRWLFHPGLAMGANFNPMPWFVASIEARGHLFWGGTVTPAFQLTYSAGVRF